MVYELPSRKNKNRHTRKQIHNPKRDFENSKSNKGFQKQQKNWRVWNELGGRILHGQEICICNRYPTRIILFLPSTYTQKSVSLTYTKNSTSLRNNSQKWSSEIDIPQGPYTQHFTWTSMAKVQKNTIEIPHRYVILSQAAVHWQQSQHCKSTILQSSISKRWKERSACSLIYLPDLGCNPIPGGWAGWGPTAWLGWGRHILAQCPSLNPF